MFVIYTQPMRFDSDWIEVGRTNDCTKIAEICAEKASEFNSGPKWCGYFTVEIEASEATIFVWSEIDGGLTYTSDTPDDLRYLAVNAENYSKSGI